MSATASGKTIRIGSRCTWVASGAAAGPLEVPPVDRQTAMSTASLIALSAQATCCDVLHPPSAISVSRLRTSSGSPEHPAERVGSFHASMEGEKGAKIGLFLSGGLPPWTSSGARKGRDRARHGRLVGDRHLHRPRARRARGHGLTLCRASRGQAPRGRRRGSPRSEGLRIRVIAADLASAASRDALEARIAEPRPDGRDPSTTPVSGAAENVFHLERERVMRRSGSTARRCSTSRRATCRR